MKTSTDGGKTWQPLRVLHAAYYELRDGTLGVLYERGEKSAVERITFALLWLK